MILCNVRPFMDETGFPTPPLRVVFAGTYDTVKPRVRILLRGLRENGIEVMSAIEKCGRGEDKSQIKGLGAKRGAAFRRREFAI